MYRILFGLIAISGFFASSGICESIWTTPEINRLPRAQFAMPISVQKPEYPKKVSGGCLNADVLLSFKLSKTGGASRIEAIWSSSIDKAFTSAAKAVVKKGIFLPPAYYAAPIPEIVYYVVRFRCYNGYVPGEERGVVGAHTNSLLPQDSLPKIIRELDDLDWSNPRSIMLIPMSSDTPLAKLAECDVWFTFECDSVGVASMVTVIHSTVSDSTCIEMAKAVVTDWIFNGGYEPFVKQPIKRFVKVSIRNQPVPGDNENVTYPKMTAAAVPQYPIDVQLRKERGTVWVRSLVSKTGSVRLANLWKSCGYRTLDSLAVVSGYDCKFSPLIKDGNEAACWVRYRVAFGK